MTKLLNPTTDDFAGWSALLGDREERKIGNNTRAERVNRRDETGMPGVAIVLHSTSILTFWQDGNITLNSGGWQSVTTKQRLNALLPRPLGVIQRNFQWFLVDSGVEIEFRDGMNVHISDRWAAGVSA